MVEYRILSSTLHILWSRTVHPETYDSCANKKELHIKSSWNVVKGGSEALSALLAD